MYRLVLLIFAIVLLLSGCGGGGGGDEVNLSPLNLPDFSSPSLPEEFIISGNAIYSVTENCIYTEDKDIVENCLEVEDGNDLDGNNSYMFAYNTEVPDSEEYVINRFHFQLTSLDDGETIEWDADTIEWYEDSDALYRNFYGRFNIYDYALCGAYEMKVWAIDKKERKTPEYTFTINISKNCNVSPSLPQEFIISSHTVYVVTENCEYTEEKDIVQNCLELADDNNLAGNNFYRLKYLAEVPSNEDYIIDRIHTQLTRLKDGANSEWETDITDWIGDVNTLYKDLYDPFVIYSNALCGEYELDIWAIDTMDRTTPVYTYNINVTTNCYSSN